VLVCSAFSKVTDQLINAGKLAEKKDNVTYLEIFESFKERHRAAIEALDYQTLKKKDVMMEEFDESMIRVEDILKGINLLGELSEKTLAQLVSFGERFSSFIVAGALRNADSAWHLCKCYQTRTHRFQLSFSKSKFR
jgi:aspartokinase/homoserine dehydrogenase 1